MNPDNPITVGDVLTYLILPTDCDTIKDWLNAVPPDTEARIVYALFNNQQMLLVLYECLGLHPQFLALNAEALRTFHQDVKVWAERYKLEVAEIMDASASDRTLKILFTQLRQCREFFHEAISKAHKDFEAQQKLPYVTIEAAFRRLVFSVKALDREP